jgi:hypothetical protein
VVPRQDPERPGPRRPAKDPYRKAAFREAARTIVYKDRDDRRAGLSVDTAGAITRALERAYAQGFADAQVPASSPPVPPDAGAADDEANGPVEWVLIPPRPRDAFWTICLFTLGRDPAAAPDGAGHLYPTMTPSGRPGWQLVTRTGREDKPFGQTTLLPLVRLGLLDPMREPDRRLVVSARGLATWRRFLERGGQFPGDLTDPAR